MEEQEGQHLRGDGHGVAQTVVRGQAGGLRDSILGGRRGNMDRLWLGLLGGPGGGTWRGKVRCVSRISIGLNRVNKLWCLLVGLGMGRLCCRCWA